MMTGWLGNSHDISAELARSIVKAAQEQRLALP
jgi:hypothetical protein